MTTHRSGYAATDKERQVVIKRQNLIEQGKL
jgi:hypothetical protein